MVPLSVDVAIIGSGFGGSLLALLLARQGKRVVLVDRAAHPRFAIGESSTPIADMILADLAMKYELPAIAPLAQYGSWCRAYPDLPRGRKRGFSYFRHERGAAFAPRKTHDNELLVAASSDDDHCDTHWFRADLDHFFAREAVAAGVTLFENSVVDDCGRQLPWQLMVRSGEDTCPLRAKFLVDATGGGEFGRDWLNVRDATFRMRTYSRAIYSHFRDVGCWRDFLLKHDAPLADHPFDCDGAALHHVFDDAWMWMLRFDHGVVSVGLALGRSHAQLPFQDPAAVWQCWLDDYPSVAEQLRSAHLAAVPGELIATERMQRRADRAVGENWAALPHAFGFVDPLHSTGIAFTLSGVERLASILDRHWKAPKRMRQLLDYERALRQELELIDKLVDVAYRTSASFPRFVLSTMLYFTAAVAYENRRQAREQSAFLCANDVKLRRAINQSCQRLLQARNDFDDERMIDYVWSDIRRAIAPFNTAGLCDREAENMYRHTAAR